MRAKLPSLIAFGFFFCALIGWLMFFFQFSPFDVPSEPSVQASEGEKEEKQQEWFYVMNGKNQDFHYPINEMGLKYESDSDLELMRVFIDDLSEYRFYCINQILLDRQVEYAYQKTDSAIRLVVFLNDPVTQKKTLDDFEYYKIQYTIK